MFLVPSRDCGWSNIYACLRSKTQNVCLLPSVPNRECNWTTECQKVGFHPLYVTTVIIRWEGLILDDPLCTLVQLDQAFPHFLGEGDFTVAKNRFRACQYVMPATVWFPCKAYLLEDELSPYSGMDGLILKNNFAQWHTHCVCRCRINTSDSL